MKRRWYALIALVVIAGLVAAGLIYAHNRTGSIYHPHARFVPQANPTLPKRGPERFAWPFYGYTKNHTRYFPAPASLHPPFERTWERGGSSLREFPPVLSENRIFQLTDDGTLSALDKYTGKTMWSHRLGQLSAASPAIVGDTVYATILSRDGGPEGRFAALDARTGKLLWSRDLPSRSESSPLVDGGRVFFGSENGTVYALNRHTGHLIWTYHAAGAVKASPTLSHGVLYFGDYSGHVQAISEGSGRRIWLAGSEGALLGSGTFYSTAAVVYGRVFLGNTDGRVYAYDASSGRLDWAYQTGAYVYASPAVTDAPGLGPTLYVGSYDGNFYAINARSGHVDWSYDAGGKISGSATILGRYVYFADLGTRRTYGLGISTGRVAFTMDTGSFDPVISDGKRVFLTGYTGLYALAPVDPPSTTPHPRAARSRRTARAHDPARSARRSSPARHHAPRPQSTHPALHSRRPHRASP